jgi:hypothetical protein
MPLIILFNDNSYVVDYDLAFEDAINENPKKKKLYEGEQKVSRWVLIT